MSKFWPQHRGAELGVSVDIFGNYDVYTGNVQKDTKSKIPLRLKYSVLFCRRLQKWFQQNQRNQLPSIS